MAVCGGRFASRSASNSEICLIWMAITTHLGTPSRAGIVARAEAGVASRIGCEA